MKYEVVYRTPSGGTAKVLVEANTHREAYKEATRIKPDYVILSTERK